MMRTIVKFQRVIYLYIAILINNILRYEDNNLDYYVDGDVSQRMATHPECEDLKNKIKQ